MNIQGKIANILELYPTHNEILMEVFSYLSPKDLVTSSLACRIFYTIAQSENLRNRSLGQYYQNPSSFNMEQARTSSQVSKLYQTISKPEICSDEDMCYPLDNMYLEEFSDSDDESILEMRIPNFQVKEKTTDLSPIHQALLIDDLEELKYLVAEGFKADRSLLKISILRKSSHEVIFLLKQAGAKVDESIIRDALETGADEHLLKVLLDGESIVSDSLLDYALDIGASEGIINTLFQHM